MFPGANGRLVMDIKRCDVRTCNFSGAIEEFHTVSLLGKEYDLCQSCFEILEDWINNSFFEGRDPNMTISPHWYLHSDNGNPTIEYVTLTGVISDGLLPNLVVPSGFIA